MAAKPALVETRTVAADWQGLEGVLALQTGTEAGTDRHMAEAAIELVGIYAKIPTARARAAFLALAKALARHAEAPPSLAA